MTRWKYTADIPDGFDMELARIARVVLDCDPMDLARPLFNESGFSYKAHNPNGDAAGIFQAMPATLKGLGFVGDWRDFTRLNALEQLPWLAKYYAPYRGKLVNATAVYMATFCPAFLAHANEPEWVICGSRPSDPRKSWYPVNIGLDPKVGDPRTRKGWIRVSDLTLAITRADVGPRWDELAMRITVADAAFWGPRVMLPEPEPDPDPALDPRNALVGAAAPSLIRPPPDDDPDDAA
jgi:hypothetical protein